MYFERERKRERRGKRKGKERILGRLHAQPRWDLIS